LTRHGIARSGRMALIERHAGHRVCPDARSRLASIDLRAEIVVIADGAVHHDRIAARSRGRIARSGEMALVLRRANDRVRPEAYARLARIGLCTSVTVVAIRSIGNGRIATNTRCRIARARYVALVERRASDRVCPSTSARLTRIRLGTRIAIGTRRAVIRVRIAASARGRIARARYVALIERRADDRIGPRAHADLARIRLRTSIAVIAVRPIIGIGIVAKAGRRIASSNDMALIERRTNDRVCPSTSARLTRIGLRTSIAIGARRTVIRDGIATSSRGRIACPHEMTLIERCAGHRIGPRAHTDLARIRLRTRIAIIAVRPIRGIGIAASARRRITRPRNMALIKRRTSNRVCPSTSTRLTRIRLRTSIAVIAARPIIRIGIAASAGRRITRPRNMALIERQTRDRIRPRATTRLAGVGLRTSIAISTYGTVWRVGIVANAG